MLADVADLYGCSASEEAIGRAVYKAYDCGPWIRFDTHEPLIRMGSIVEGSEAEFEVTPLNYGKLEGGPEEVRAAVHAWLREAADWLEGETSAAWHEANEAERSDDA